MSRLQREREAPEQTNSIASPPPLPSVQQPSLAPNHKQPWTRRDASLRSKAKRTRSPRKSAGSSVSGKRPNRSNPRPRLRGPSRRAAEGGRASTPEPSAALASLPQGMPARVLIRYPRNNADARRQAESVADALKRRGVELADLRESDGAVRTGISFFYAQDAATARQIGALIGVTPVLHPQMRDGLMARPGGH